jgi:Ni2+-binding GTPase involved in maturation of urease and hydrogenase
MSIPLLLVGGFLGTGKTTLLWQAARRLTSQGLRVGLITNDQAPDLVDTALLLRHGLDVREVTGGCFCCDFAGLLDAASTLKNRFHADVLVAEAVGSCADLAATTLQPLKDRHARDFRLARLSVVADPTRIEAALGARATDLHPSAAYIVRKQLEEADVIVLNKADLLGEAEVSALRARVEAGFPGTELRFVSALEGQGVDEWLVSTQSGEPAGRRILEIDYDTYAEGEAVLGWLNADIALGSTGAAADWRRFSEALMGSLRDKFQRRNASVGHVKLLLTSGSETLTANLTQARGSVSLRGDASKSPSAELVVNARVELSPDELESAVRAAVAAAAGGEIRPTFRTLRSLRPGRPSPTYRYVEAV